MATVMAMMAKERKGPVLRRQILLYPVTDGETIAIVSAGGDHAKNIRLIAYVSASDGKKVRPGMSVYFTPSALRAADYGYIRGIVSSVSLFPVSGDSISAELKNRDFAGSLTRNGAVMRV